MTLWQEIEYRSWEKNAKNLVGLSTEWGKMQPSFIFLQNGSKMGMSYGCINKIMLKVMAWNTVGSVGFFFFLRIITNGRIPKDKR